MRLSAGTDRDGGGGGFAVDDVGIRRLIANPGGCMKIIAKLGVAHGHTFASSIHGQAVTLSLLCLVVVSANPLNYHSVRVGYPQSGVWSRGGAGCTSLIIVEGLDIVDRYILTKRNRYSVVLVMVRSNIPDSDVLEKASG
jgi:hypothetical protein